MKSERTGYCRRQSYPATRDQDSSILVSYDLVQRSGFPVLCSHAVFSRRQWSEDQDMGHGFFVPLIAGWIVWRKRDELLALGTHPNWWGLAVVAFAAIQLERARPPGFNREVASDLYTCDGLLSCFLGTGTARGDLRTL